MAVCMTITTVSSGWISSLVLTSATAMDSDNFEFIEADSHSISSVLSMSDDFSGIAAVAWI